MKTLGVVMLFLLFCGSAQAHDAFDAITCGADIPKLLIGKTMPGGKVIALEARHKAIALADLGAEEISDGLQMVEWRICAKDYNILVGRRDVMRDVLPFPDHSRATPEFAGICQVGGKDMAEPVYALLDNKTGFDTNAAHHYSPSGNTMLPALSAWQIDEKRAKFRKISVDGLRCPRSGINTLDGGP
ncbi:MAG: hypothetical protein HY243_14680 [Proteobacteria bacterium]|nr:hypothetical protein [Pseudomonadota bacterium]